MEYYYEPIVTDQRIQAKILCHSVRVVPLHWHDNYELLLVLFGKISLTIDGIEKEMNEGDLLIINPNQIHNLSSFEENYLLAVQIPSIIIKNAFSDNDTYFFDSFSASSVTFEKYNLIRHLMVKFCSVCDKKENGYIAHAKSILYRLIYELYQSFAVKGENDRIKTQIHQVHRLTEIMNYVQQNSKSVLTLNKVANEHGLSPNYFANYFKKYTGITFLNYLNEIRLDTAVNDVIYSDNSITDIAQENGFANIRAFEKVFNERLGMNPNMYRKMIQSNRKTSIPVNQQKAFVNYFAIEHTDKYSLLQKYLTSDVEDKAINQSIPVKNQFFSIKLKTIRFPIVHTWKKITSIGMAYEGLKTSIQCQLKVAQKEIGFEYIRFHGLLDDTMMVYSENEKGDPKFYFGRIYELFDFLLSIGLKPFIEISFMPSKLAAHQHLFFNSRSVISLPKNMDNWCELIKSLLNALIERYKIEEVRTWYFEFWNEPEYANVMWDASQEEYHNFYKRTYEVLKQIDHQLLIGGPSCSVSVISENWFTKYVAFCEENSCIPDFISYHVYPVEHHGQVDWDTFRNFSLTSDKKFISKTSVSADVDYLKNKIINTKKVLEGYNWDRLPQFITEWNSSSWHWDLCSDTCYKAAYIARNISETLDLIDGITFWTLSDNMDELFLTNNLFHGGLGLFTTNGIKKASYYSFCLLNKLCDQLVERGPVYLLTGNKTDTEYKLLVYNYSHYNKNYAQFDTSYISVTNREEVFVNRETYNYIFEIIGFKNNRVKIIETLISPENGSSYDMWLKMGAQDQLSCDDVEILKKKSCPIPRYSTAKINNNRLLLNCTLPYNSIALYEISVLPD